MVKRVVRKNITRSRARKSTRSRSSSHKRKAVTPRLRASPKKTYVGSIVHYYTSINVGVVQLTGSVKHGDWISLEGATTRFRQRVESLHLDHEPVHEARAGQIVGLRVRDRVREGDKVFRD